MLPTQLFKFGKALLPCTLLTRKVLVLIFAALIFNFTLGVQANTYVYTQTVAQGGRGEGGG